MRCRRCLGGERVGLGPRQPIAHHELTGVVEDVGVEDELVGIREGRHQVPAAPQDAVAFSPDRGEVGHEQCRGRIDDQIEDAVTEGRQVVHPALDEAQVQSVTIGDEAISSQLLVGDVEHRHRGAGRSEQRALLPAPGGQAEHPAVAQITQPLRRHRFVIGEEDRESTRTGLGHLLR